MTLKSKLKKTAGVGLLGLGTLSSMQQAPGIDSMTSLLALGVYREKVCDFDYEEFPCEPFKRRIMAFNLPDGHPASYLPKELRETLGYFTGPLGEMAMGLGLLLGPAYFRKEDDKK